MRVTLKDGTTHEVYIYIVKRQDIGFGAAENVRRKSEALEKVPSFNA